LNYSVSFKCVKPNYTKTNIKSEYFQSFIEMNIYNDNYLMYIITFSKIGDIFLGRNVFISNEFEPLKKFLVENDILIILPEYKNQTQVTDFYQFQLTTKSLLMAL